MDTDNTENTTPDNDTAGGTPHDQWRADRIANARDTDTPAMPAAVTLGNPDNTEDTEDHPRPS